MNLANYRETAEYNTLFKRVWNGGKEFLDRCKRGKLPHRRDFDIFYQEGDFESLLLLYKTKEAIHENTIGYNLKLQMESALGCPYPLCKEDIESLRRDLHVCRIWLSAGPIKLSECNPRNTNLSATFEADPTYQMCPEFRDGRTGLDEHVVLHGTNALVLYGLAAASRTKVPQGIVVVVLAELQGCDVPSWWHLNGEVFRCTASVHIWVKTKQPIPVYMPALEWNPFPCAKQTRDCNFARRVEQILGMLRLLLCESPPVIPGPQTKALSRVEGCLKELGQLGVPSYYFVQEILSQRSALGIFDTCLLENLAASPQLSNELRSLFDATYKKFKK